MGIAPEAFWNFTIYEFSIMQKGFIKARIHERNCLMFTAYYTAIFNRQRTLPPLKDFLLEENPGEIEEQEEQSPEQMETIIRALNAVFGGNEVVTK